MRYISAIYHIKVRK